MITPRTYPRTMITMGIVDPLAADHLMSFAVGDPVWWHDPDEPPQHERRAGVVVRVSRQGRSVDVEWFDGSGGVRRTRPERLSRRLRTNGV